MNVTVFEVGQADCTLIETDGGTNVLVDTDSGKKAVEALNDHGIEDIDAIIQTHPHTDHIGGDKKVMEEFGPDVVFVPEHTQGVRDASDLSDNIIEEFDRRGGSPTSTFEDAIEEANQEALTEEELNEITESEAIQDTVKNSFEGRRDNEVVTVEVSSQETEDGHDPLRLEVDNTEFEIFSPPPSETAARETLNEQDDVNATGVTLRVEDGNTSHLITGDMTEKSEEYLVENFSERLSTDVYHVGHHGSRHGNTTDFLEAVDPEVSVVSSGLHPGYKHPHGEVLSRLSRVDSDIYWTEEHGTVNFESTEIGVETYPEREGVVEPYKLSKRRDTLYRERLGEAEEEMTQLRFEDLVKKEPVSVKPAKETNSPGPHRTYETESVDEREDEREKQRKREGEVQVEQHHERQSQQENKHEGEDEREDYRPTPRRR